MGSVMKQMVPIIVWNPKNDERYNEKIDMKSDNPMYCFPIYEWNEMTQ